MNRPEAEQIAAAISIIRPRWLQSSLATMLTRLPEHLRIRPARDVMLALVWLAYDPEQETPRLLREDGPWWNLAALAGPGTLRPESMIAPLTCEHGNRPARCEECRRTPEGPTPEQREAIKAAIAQGRDVMASRAAKLTIPGEVEA